MIFSGASAVEGAQGAEVVRAYAWGAVKAPGDRRHSRSGNPLRGVLDASFEARAKAWRDNPALDIDAREIENTANRGEIRRTISRMPEDLLDVLIAKYDPNAVQRFAWL